MVNALKEVWRVLGADGVLLDLRPIAAHWPLEVLVDNVWQRAGRFDDSPSLPDDEASNQSLVTIAREGWFAREHDAIFQLLYYWDSFDDMQAYIAERWAPSVILPDHVLDAAKRLSTDEGARLRGLVTMSISRWKKVNGRGRCS